MNFVSNNSDYSDKFDFNFIPAEVIFEMGINNVDTFINAFYTIKKIADSKCEIVEN